ncbi:MAG: hypothetical protein ACO1SX_23390 [Actinomycetota bacterium]
MKRLAIFMAAAATLIAAGFPCPAAAAGDEASAPKAVAAGGIQWFTRLKDGLAEAKRTGRPILFLSAAPSCGGVPGVW